MSGYEFAGLALGASVAGGLAAFWLAGRRAVSRFVLGSPEDVERRARAGGYRVLGTCQVAARLRNDGEACLLVDTRTTDEYQAGHIAGARSLPVTPTWRGRRRAKAALQQLLGPLGRETCLVFY